MEDTYESEMVVTEEIISEPAPVIADRKPLLTARWLILAGALVSIPIIGTILLVAGFICIRKVQNSQIRFAAAMGIFYSVLSDKLLQLGAILMPVYAAPIQSMGGLFTCWMIYWCILTFIFMSMMGILLDVDGIYKKSVYGLMVAAMASFCSVIMVMIGLLEIHTSFGVFVYLPIFLNIVMVVYWWQLCSRSYPQELIEKQPAGRLIFNHLSNGFLIMIPFMMITFFVLSKAFLA